jgi:hypothetical protein
MPENTTNRWTYGPNSPNYLARFGGPSRVAALLTELGYGDGREVTRQAAYSLWKHRRGNGFPDRVRVEVPGSWRQLFDLEEVEKWARDPERGAHAAVRTAIDQDGLM